MSGQDALRNDLSASIDKLEEALAAPLVSGEHEGWLSATESAARSVANELRRDVESGYDEEFVESLGVVDTEVLSPLEKLKEEDARLEKDLERLLAQIDVARVASGQASGSTLAYQGIGPHVVEDGLRIVVDAKKRLRTRLTWLLEASHRETGAGD